ncbi:MAG: TIGR02921 family PEP-CTERM protein [Anaerolineales bacterium]|nr:TIGR02921 family PEP-CTERM protein [Anaerolineales bacterium]
MTASPAARPSLFRRLFSPTLWAYGLFWSWNVIFLAFMLLGFAPQLLPELLAAVRTQLVPPDFLLYAVVLTAIPVLTVALGATLLRRSPGRLFALGYGVEGPLMLIVGLRFFVVRELMPAVAVLLAAAGLGLLTYLWHLLDQRLDARRPALHWLRAAGLTLLLGAGLYAGLWMLFYAVPLGYAGLEALGEILKNLGRFLTELWRELITLELRWVPFAVLGTTLAIYTGTLFVVMPLAVPVLYVRAWWQGWRSLAAGGRWPRAAALTAGVLGAAIALVVVNLGQPQRRVFDLLETPPASPAEAQALLGRQAEIRAGLLNAYLAPFRYVSALGEVTHVSEIYSFVLKLPERQAAAVQSWYEVIARPVLYVPARPADLKLGDPQTWAFTREPEAAAALYQRFFDAPINVAERRAVVDAARSTWSPAQAQAAWQAVDDREVHLLRQEVTFVEHGDWAEGELYEVYQNQTATRQEVVYYFSLPESAVITGLWLGNSADRAARFTYQVAPRGAAQAVYQAQVRRNLDPALVEQIGPRQYRLRVFPIEPQTFRRDESALFSTTEPGPELHLWLTWRGLAQEQAWPLPRLAEKRNVYWDTATVRLLNGQAMPADADTWLPASAPASAPVTPRAHRVDFPGGESLVITPVSPAELPPPPAGLRLAVVLDRSRSMAAQADAVAAALGQLTGLGAAVDVYLTAAEVRGEPPTRAGLAEVDPGRLLYFGGQNPGELLAQFAALYTGETYDAILVLTDSSGYELGPSPADLPALPAPVWMVHLGGFPLGYDDATLEAIQASGGGAAASLTEALTRLAAGGADVLDGYRWEHAPADPAAAADPDFAPLAARRLILAKLPNPQLAAQRLEVLDQLHALAAETSIVTPYSSMIVLVTAQQEALLKQLAGQDDRFEREFEAVGETVAITGVPEPEEWLLMGLGAVLLAAYLYTRRRPAAMAR